MDCARFEKLVLSGALPQHSSLKITVFTDQGEQANTFHETGAQEFVLDLQGAARLSKITLELLSQNEGAAAGWLTAISLVDTDQLGFHLDQFEHYEASWHKWIRSPDYEPEFKPAIGIFLKPEDIERLRSTALDYYRNQAENLKQEYARVPPESRIQELARQEEDRPLYREARGYAKQRLARGGDLAQAALITRDKELLRLAARWAMSLAVCPSWGKEPLQHVPACPWEVRAFNESYASEDIAKIIDLAGEMFTQAGRDYLLRRLGLYATSWITYMTWKHEYIFECNQLAYFNQGRVCAYLAMEPYMPRVKKYLEIALDDIQDSFKVVLEPDGGYLEGPSYFCATARRHCQTLDYYARARGLNVLGIIPEQLKKTDDYAQAIASTTRFDYLPICDCDQGASLETWLWLARVVPNSYWVTLARKSYDNKPAQLRDPLEKELFNQIPKKGPPLKPFVFLPDTGYLASHRKIKDQALKIFIMGNKANAGHTHEDKGSFILEFAGQTFATDLGVGEYDDPLHQLYKHAQRHNMLCPTGTEERPAPPGRLPFDVKPTGSGDETNFHAVIDATPGWNRYYKRWIRAWDSPVPRELTIRDEYELNQGDGVVFYWQTALPFEVKQSTVVIRGEKGIAEIHAPPDTTIAIDEMPMQGGTSQKRIGIHKMGAAGRLEIKVTLETL